MCVAKASLIGLATAGGMLALTGSVQAQPVKEEWVARYDGPRNGSDGATAMAVDGSGNVFVTGSSEGRDAAWDYTTIKYDPAGNELWVARYNGPQDRTDSARAIAVDPLGQAYVTGRSEGCATIKYGLEGAELWVARSPALIGNAIAVDTTGSVFVTGSLSGDQGYVTIKYDSSGNELWMATYDTRDSKGGARAVAIAIDRSGYAYVTGYSDGSDSGHDYATVKYDSDGNERWVARYNGPKNDTDRAAALTIDDSGNVYVTGYSRAPRSGPDYATIKYDATGNELWVARYDGPGQKADFAQSITVDQTGVVYITGLSKGIDTKDDYATVKYDPAGNERWVARYDGPRSKKDAAVDIGVDGSGNVYVTGVSDCRQAIYADCDHATVKYGPAGEELWVARYNGPADLSDRARALALDGLGNVYVTGTTDYEYQSNEFPGDYATIKYSQSSGGCSGREKLKANCKVIRSFNLVKAVALKGTQGDTVEFCLDDDDCKEKTLNQRGKVKAKWKGRMPGEHAITAEWDCGANQKKSVDCPNP